MRKWELKYHIKKLEEQLEEINNGVTKYVAVTNEKTKERTVNEAGPYGQRYTRTLPAGEHTIVLVTRDSQPDTITLNGKWSIEQIKEASL